MQTHGFLKTPVSKWICLGIGFLSVCGSLFASPERTTEWIRVDQFGYPPQTEKVAVVSQAEIGFNAPGDYVPSATYEVRNWETDEVVYSGPVEAWKAGQLQEQSGDRGYWFDFSEVTAPGSYYLFDVAQQIGSYRFEIGNDVYNTVKNLAFKTFFIIFLGYYSGFYGKKAMT